MKQLLGQHSTVGKQSFWAPSLAWRLQSLSFQSVKLYHLFSLCVSSGYPGQETCLPSALSSDLPRHLCFYHSLNILCPLKSLSVFFLAVLFIWVMFPPFSIHVPSICPLWSCSEATSSGKPSLILPTFLPKKLFWFMLVICRIVFCGVFLFPCIISSFKDQIIQFFIPEHRVLWWRW